MPLTATPMISDAPSVALMPWTRVPAHSAAVPATTAIAIDTMTSTGLYSILSGMFIAAMPM